MLKCSVKTRIDNIGKNLFKNGQNLKSKMALLVQALKWATVF